MGRTIKAYGTESCKKGQNKGGKYLYKDGIKKHFYGNDIEEMMKDGWTTFEQRKAI